MTRIMASVMMITDDPSRVSLRRDRPGETLPGPARGQVRPRKSKSGLATGRGRSLPVSHSASARAAPVAFKVNLNIFGVPCADSLEFESRQTGLE